MQEKDLASLLDKLHGELANLEHLPPEQTERARALAGDIARLLESQAERRPPGEQDGLVAQAKEAVEHFSESHPRLSQAVASIAEALSQAGL